MRQKEQAMGKAQSSLSDFIPTVYEQNKPEMAIAHQTICYLKILASRSHSCPFENNLIRKLNGPDRETC